METEEQVIDEHKSSMEVSVIGFYGMADFSKSIEIIYFFNPFTLFKVEIVSASGST